VAFCPCRRTQWRDHVWIAGRDEHHTEGRYYLEWYQEGKRRRQPIPSFDRVLDAARAKSLELNALKAGILIAPDKASTPGQARLTIGAAIDEYLEYVRTQRSLRTYRTYRPTLNSLLRNSYAKIYVDEVSREDILKFMSDCFNLGLGARTVYDKLVVVLQLFKWNGRTGLIETNDWPANVDTIRPIYEPEEIAMMLQHAEPDEAMLIKFLVASGFRDREVRYLLWRDIDFRQCLRFVDCNCLHKRLTVRGCHGQKEVLVDLKIEHHL
jgi:integrase/recombinase XerD